MVSHATSRRIGVLLLPGLCLLQGCSFMSGAGPSSRAVNRVAEQAPVNADIKIVDVTETVARQVLASTHTASFADVLGDAVPVGTIIGRGDVLDISIWEAPPAALFGAVSAMTEASLASNQTARGTALPEQMVGNDGRITVPFAGAVPAAGRTPQDVARDITARLTGKAHQPQVIVRLVRNATREVTVVGDVSNSARVPLTAKGERLLDVLASAGGVRQPVNKTTIQITRGDRMASEPLQTVIADPRQNIRLQPGDVVTALFQPYSFIALGATGSNSEIAFEGTGISLAQALGRVGGLRDDRANVRGVFLFRLESPDALDPEIARTAHLTPDGKVPVIYRVDMKNPATFFIAQSFPVQNKDVLYVSNAPLADLQKFVNILSALVVPAITVQNAVKN